MITPQSSLHFLGQIDATFSPLDTGIVIGYIIFICILGIWVGFRKNTSSSQLFLAGRSLGWPVIGISLFCANISSIHLVGLAADGYRVGMPVGNFEWGASFCLIILGLVFAPFYFRSRLSTLPEYVERRYSPITRTILGVIFVLSALLVHIGMSLYAGAKLMNVFFGFNITTAIIVIAGVTAIYTVLGGLKAVMITNVVQVIILLAGAATLTYLGWQALGEERGITTYAQLKEAVSPDISPTVLQPIKNADGGFNDFSWLCVLVGYPILGIWYWCTDQTIVQNVLAAKSEKDGRDGAIFGGFLKILPVFLMVLPGVMAYALYRDEIQGENNNTLMILMQKLLQPGFLGIFAAGLLAALMSTVAAALNSTATLASSDILKRLRPDTPDKTLVWFGRIASIVVVLLAMAWSTQGDKFKSIFEAINKIPMMFAPAITTIFLMGVFWKRGTKQAAIGTLLFNMGIGVIYLLVDIPIITDKQLIAEGLGLPFMLVGGIFFVFCLVIYIIVSLATPAPDEAHIKNLVWEHPLGFLREGRISGITDPRIMALLLLVIMVVLYVVM
ncbi:sodium/solute symporter [Haloferula sp. A504]|uniref:sodium:solute symporter family transporter n=1 Tax=Haloferula sp. A504 TaxID=3373601 RepID=UPI0031C224D4|nr:sodium/solute symporter [Verrucomicrobiaceae bacterium E54]